MFHTRNGKAWRLHVHWWTGGKEVRLVTNTHLPILVEICMYEFESIAHRKSDDVCSCEDISMLQIFNLARINFTSTIPARSSKMPSNESLAPSSQPFKIPLEGALTDTVSSMVEKEMQADTTPLRDLGRYYD